MKLVIISDSESDDGNRYSVFRRPTLMRMKSRRPNKYKSKTSSQVKLINNSEKSNLNKVCSSTRVTRSLGSSSKQKNGMNYKDFTESYKTSNISTSQANKYVSESQLIRADKKLLSCLVNLENKVCSSDRVTRSSEKSNLNKVCSSTRVTRSLQSSSKQKNKINYKDFTEPYKTLNISTSQANKYVLVSELIRADKKLLSCFVHLERIDVHDLRSANNSEPKLSRDNLRTRFYSKINCFTSLERLGNMDFIKQSDLECSINVNKLPLRNVDTVSKLSVEKLQDGTSQNIEEPDEHKDQVKMIHKWTLSSKISENYQLTIEGYIDGKIFSKVPVSRRLTSRKFISINNEIFYLQDNIYDPDNGIPQPLKTKFKEGLPRTWKFQWTSWIKGANQVSQDSVKSRHKKTVVDASSDKISFDSNSDYHPGSVVMNRAHSSEIQTIIQNNIKPPTSSSNLIDEGIIRRSSRLRNKIEKVENTSPVVHKTRILKSTCSNLLENHNRKKYFEVKNLDCEKEVKAQIVHQESVTSRVRKCNAQTGKDKMDFDSGNQPRCRVRTRKKIIQNKKVDSKIIDKENATLSSRLQQKCLSNKNGNTVLQETKAFKRKNSNIMQKQSSKLKNMENEEKVKAQIDEIDINFKCPKSLKDRKKLKSTISKLVQARKGTMDLFEDEENSELLKDPGDTHMNNDTSKLWDMCLQSNVYGSHDLSSTNLATTPTKLWNLSTTSTPTSLSPASSYCQTPRTVYADHYIHRQLKSKNKKKCVNNIQNPTVPQTTNLNRSEEIKANEAYEAFIAGKDLPKSLFNLIPRLERSGSSVFSDTSHSTN